MNSVSAITLWQPWASLIRPEAYGKHFETRDWPAPDWAIGKPLAIHAAARSMQEEEEDLCKVSPFRDAFLQMGAKWRHHECDKKGAPYEYAVPFLPYSAIVAVALLQECHQVDNKPPRIVHTQEFPEGRTIPPPEPERSFGGYDEGRWVWVLSDIRVLPEPVAMRGQRKLWPCAHPSVVAVACQIAADFEAAQPRQAALFE